MFEPKYQPTLNEAVASVSGMRFSIMQANGHIKQDGPDTDPLHIHSYLEIFINVSSDVSFLVNNNLYPVPEGDAVVSCPGDIHMGLFRGNDKQEHICIWIDADMLLPIFSFLHKKDLCPLFSFDEKTRRELRTLAVSLVDICKSGGTELQKLSYLMRILTIFEKNNSIDIQKADIPEMLQEVLDDIHKNFSTIRGISDILTAHFLSSATLTRWFRKHLQTSPRDYLESVRLSNAAVMLSNGYSVTDACMRSGFSDCSHFIALFKRKFGKTPLRYKKELTDRP